MNDVIRIKSPSEIISLEYDYKDILGGDGIPVSSPPSEDVSVWALDENSPPHLSQSGASHSANKVEVLIGGGISGKNYVVKNIITTSNGKKYERSFRIYVQEA